jgi:hypothetical protein
MAGGRHRTDKTPRRQQPGLGHLTPQSHHQLLRIASHPDKAAANAAPLAAKGDVASAPRAKTRRSSMLSGDKTLARLPISGALHSDCRLIVGVPARMQ